MYKNNSNLIKMLKNLLKKIRLNKKWKHNPKPFKLQPNLLFKYWL